MKIAVIVAHHMPEIGYQDVYLPRAIARKGYKTRVFTSNKVNTSGKKKVDGYKTGLEIDSESNLEIYRIPFSIGIRSIVIPFGLNKYIYDYQPDKIIIIGLGKLFTLPALFLKNIDDKILIVGDSKEYFSSGLTKLFRVLFFNFIKKPFYKIAVNNCRKIVLNTKETYDFYASFLNKIQKSHFDSKYVELFLGYDDKMFYFDNKLRQKERGNLKISDDQILIITSTRITKNKNIKKIISAISKLIEEGYNLNYIIVGLDKNTSYGKEIIRLVKNQNNPGNFIIKNFTNKKEMQKYFCAADLGIWTKAAITIQESMGTGLPVVLKNKKIVSHLIKDGKNGYYDYGKGFIDTLKKAILWLSGKKNSIDFRKDIEQHNQKFSYSRISQTIIDL